MVCTPLISTAADGSTVGVGFVCGPGRTYRRFYADCPICERRRRFVARHDGIYYGETQMCCGCGDSWQDGELGYRPFRPGWRKESIATARRWWAEALTPRQYNAVIRAELNEYQADWSDEDAIEDAS
jgi:hypothetical protein